MKAAFYKSFLCYLPAKSNRSISFLCAPCGGCGLLKPVRHGSFEPYKRHRLNRSKELDTRKVARRDMTIKTEVRRVQETQAVDAPLTASAVFLVCSITNSADSTQKIRDTLAGLAGSVKTVSFRDPSARLSCVAAIGSEAWDKIIAKPRPAELHPLPIIKGETHSTVSTPGDLLFHIRSDRRDLCFEFERQLLDSLGDSVQVVDETVGFRYFDACDLLGFVDGTANPTGAEASLSALVAGDDPSSVGGSYVVVQKYLHDLKAWNVLSTEQQEQIVGRTKLDNVEQDDASSGQRSHKTLATIEEENGTEHDITRDNMPFGSPGSGQYGTYFIGYSGRLWVIEKMLNRMFVGEPAGLHDRILDYSRPVTGTTYFAPSLEVLESLG